MQFLSELHPHVIHFPIALIITYSLLEFSGIVFKNDFVSKSAYLILCIAIVFSFFAAITGNEALNEFKGWNEVTIPVAENHQLFANLTIWYFTAILIVRTILIVKKKFNSNLKYIFLILLPIGVYFVYQTGKYGGELMHKYGVGTEIKSNQPGDD